MCIFWHRWSKWEVYQEHGRCINGILSPKSIRGKETEYMEVRQRRRCRHCGKTQDELVKDGPLVP